MSTYGFIGTGNMGSALAKAVAKATDPSNIFLANRTRSKAEKIAAEIGCKVCDNDDVCWNDYIFLGVKPNMVEGVINSISDDLLERNTPAVLISMAAAVKIETIEGYMNAPYPIVRIMPNTPVAFGEGVILYSANKNVSESALNELVSVLSYAGKCIKIEEKLMDAATAVSGCGPAYAQMFMEALADGGVACGLPRSVAYELSARMVLGSAKMLLESGKTPGQLKDEVCSPGGTTIEGVRTLEEAGFRGAAMDAVIAAYEKALDLAK